MMSQGLNSNKGPISFGVKDAVVASYEDAETGLNLCVPQLAARVSCMNCTGGQIWTPVCYLNGFTVWLFLQVALKRLGVPFVLVRDVSLFERAEVLHVIAYLK